MRILARVLWFRTVMVLMPLIPARLEPWWLGLALLSWPRLVVRKP